MGAFGSFGAPQSAIDKKQTFGRSESRFKSLMGGTSSEDMKKSKEHSSQRNTSGSYDDQLRSPWETGPPNQRKDAGGLYDRDIRLPAGSAALGGDDASPPVLQTTRSRNIEAQPSTDEIGFASLGLGSNASFQDFSQRNRTFSQNQANQQVQSEASFGEPLSPITNPYSSPEAERAIPSDIVLDDADPPHMPSNLAHGRGFVHQLDQLGDRSQTSSTGLSRPFPQMGGLSGGGFSGGPWSAAPGAVGTPTRAFGEGSFGSFGEVGSPQSAAFGATGFFGSSGPSVNSISTNAGRGTKYQQLGSFLPAGMVDHPRSDPQRQEQGTYHKEHLTQTLH